jgi:hypothetical protein
MQLSTAGWQCIALCDERIQIRRRISWDFLSLLNIKFITKHVLAPENRVSKLIPFEKKG